MKPEEYSTFIEKTFRLKLNHNQTREIQRLLYETEIVTGKPLSNITETLKTRPHSQNLKGKDLFQYLKSQLIGMRFPITQSYSEIDSKRVFLNKLKPKPQEKIFHPARQIIPERIVIENQARDSYLERKLIEAFPDITPEYIDYYSDFLKTYNLTPANLKKPIFFVVKESWDYIKPCPCTPKHTGCGYWILNLGFGCPYDCSYCYLQQYQNFPGFVLPSNVEDFFSGFDRFFKKINRPIRIGTGEFCDSLALDHLTDYSAKLINYFSKRPVFFELKTKSSNVNNILNTKPSKNIIVSWSVNPPCLIQSEEYGAANLTERLTAAKKVQDHGFNIGLHFDPIIHYPDWEKDYQNLIEKIYSCLKPPFAWISLGTLRFNRKLKPLVETRFQKSRIIYGELLLGKDKKMRYPEQLRKEIYKKMASWIRNHDKNASLYLCMESEEVWTNSLEKIASSKQVEKGLIDKLTPE